MKKIAIVSFSVTSFVCFVLACVLVALPKTAARRPRAVVIDLEPLIWGPPRKVVCNFTTENTEIHNLVVIDGCYGTNVVNSSERYFACIGPAREMWYSPIPGCAANDRSSVACTVVMPEGATLRLVPHYYNFGAGFRRWGCEGRPNGDREEDPGTLACAVDGNPVAITEVASDSGDGCSLELTI